MRKIEIGIALMVALSGCAGYSLQDVKGVEASGADNPNVVVTSDVQVIRLIPKGYELATDIKLSPGLAESFEHALERYTDAANVRIVAADMNVDSDQNSQHISLFMNVVANGEPYALRCGNQTKLTGAVAQYLNQTPVYLDACAHQLAERLKKS